MARLHSTVTPGLAVSGQGRRGRSAEWDQGGTKPTARVPAGVDGGSFHVTPRSVRRKAENRALPPPLRAAGGCNRSLMTPTVPSWPERRRRGRAAGCSSPVRLKGTPVSNTGPVILGASLWIAPKLGPIKRILPTSKNRALRCVFFSPSPPLCQSPPACETPLLTCLRASFPVPPLPVRRPVGPQMAATRSRTRRITRRCWAASCCPPPRAPRNQHHTAPVAMQASPWDPCSTTRPPGPSLPPSRMPTGRRGRTHRAGPCPLFALKLKSRCVQRARVLPAVCPSRLPPAT